MCPHPNQWADLYAMLPERVRKRDREHGRAPMPLILGGSTAPPEVKRQRLIDNLVWGAAYGVIEEMDAHLRALEEEDWDHYGGMGLLPMDWS